MGIAISIAGFHCPLKRKPRAMTNEIAAVAITKYGALSFPEKWHNKIDAKKTEFVRISLLLIYPYNNTMKCQIAKANKARTTRSGFFNT